VGKSIDADNETPAPIHLVLIEEPEAHLHSQVQQVFVKKAYEILTKDLEDECSFTTQMVISTHSSYIIHEVGFENLHYFKRCKEKDNFHTEAIDLSNVFEKDNVKEVIFAIRQTIDGELTELYIIDLLKKFKDLKISKIANGIPIGRSIDSYDELTFLKALEDRREIEY